MDHACTSARLARDVSGKPPRPQPVPAQRTGNGAIRPALPETGVEKPMPETFVIVLAVLVVVVLGLAALQVAEFRSVFRWRRRPDQDRVPKDRAQPDRES
jgi:hypothetical protein